MPLMNPDIKALWTGALRSDRFQQGQHALTTVDEDGGNPRHCCWGVLCHLAVEAGVIPPPETERRENKAHVLCYDGQEGLPPRKVLNWAGFPEDFDGRGPVRYEADEDEIENVLSGLNDVGKEFPELAGIIDEQY